MATPSEELNATGQFFEAQYKHAFQLVEKGEVDKAEALCRELLLEPRLGRLHRAGFHFILAHGNDDNLAHAERALHIYKNLYEDNDNASADQLARQQAWVHDAQAVYDTAMQAYANELTEDVESDEGEVDEQEITGSVSKVVEEKEKGEKETVSSLSASKAKEMPAAGVNKLRRRNAEPYQSFDAPPADPMPAVGSKRRKSAVSDAGPEHDDEPREYSKSHVSSRIKRNKTDDSAYGSQDHVDDQPGVRRSSRIKRNRTGDSAYESQLE